MKSLLPLFRPRLGVALLFLATTATAAVYTFVARTPETIPAAAPAVKASVQTTPARQGPIAPFVRAYGSVDFANTELTTLSLPYAARVTRLSAAAGQPVRAGSLLAELTADPAVAAAFVQASSTATAAREELRRTQSLFAEQLTTQSQLAAAQKTLTDADATLAELQRQGASPGPRALKAPFDAVVVNVVAAQGDRLAAGASVMQVGHQGAAAAVHVSLGLDPSQAALVTVGVPVHVAPLDARSGGEHSSYPGHVTAVRQVLNAQSRLVDVSVALDPTVGSPLLPGMPVGAQIDLTPSVHWIVPRSALLTDERGDYVYQVVDGHAHRVAVSRQVESEGSYGVDGPLSDGAPLVTLGNYELEDGMAVLEATR